MKYSVIIPVYNAEKTLCRCVNSLLSEQYADMEILLINDGSSDSSGELCKAYAAEYQNIRYIAKENGGVSTARNAGLDAAAGTYVVFVDSDDFVSPRFFALIDAALEVQDSDLIQFSRSIYDGKNTTVQKAGSIKASSRAEALPHIIDAICHKMLNSPCAKLYRRSIIEANQIRFPAGVSVAEDRVFNIKYSMYIQSYMVSAAELYVVSTENENSLSRGRHKDLKRQFEIADQYFKNALREAPIPQQEKEQYQRAVNFGECRSIYHDAKLMHQDHIGWLERQKQLRKLCKEMNQKKMKYPRMCYCTLISLPVQLSLTPVIDTIAWKLTH